MPRGPQGQKRPADVIGAAIAVAKIATGELVEEREQKDPASVASGRIGGRKGGRARAEKLSADERHRIAVAAAAARWKRDSTS